MRRILVLLHRWLGLFTAAFLLLAGLTGAVIAWDHELDAWLNPALFEAPSNAPALPANELARRIELSDPRVRVTYLPLSIEPGHSLSLFVAPRIERASGKPYELNFDEVFVDPSSGVVLGQRKWGAFSLARENLMPFLYRLHYSLHLSDAPDLNVGILFMGLVAIVWTLDAFIAIVIAFPNRRVWRKSLAFRFREGSHKLTFDLHRSSGVWLWPVLLVFGVTAVSMNLAREVVTPIVSVFSPVQASPFDAAPSAEPREPALDRAKAIEVASAHARQLGIAAPVGALFYAHEWGFYGIGFFEPGNAHGDGGLGNPRLFVDAQTGKVFAKELPGEGSAGDIFMQAQFPLHSGRILGVPGRVLVSVLGAVIAMLSFTGVWLWAKKRIARARASARQRSAADMPAHARPSA